MGGGGDATSSFLKQCENGVLQYVVLKLILTAISFLLEWFGLFGEGEFTLKKGWLYISGATNLSQMWAMYCLLRFYTMCSNELRPVKPVGKLIAVKAVVFFTYSQSCIIAALHWFELLPSFIEETGEHWSTEDVGRALQDYLICIEMLIAAIVFTHIFSHREYKHELDLDAFDEEHYLLDNNQNKGPHTGSSSSDRVGGGGGSGGGRDTFGSPVKFSSSSSNNRSRTASRDAWSVDSDFSGTSGGQLQVTRSTTM
jgi:hypothetical protein